MAKILLPYAYNENQELIHIDEAQKNEHYFCPCCGSDLLLKISKIPKDQKYHKRNHFAHKNSTENHCSESFLHKLFKEKVAKVIRQKILKKEELIFKWVCDKCKGFHVGNLLKKAVDVVIEYNFGVCKADVALLDANRNVIIVLEIVVTHKPEKQTLEFYAKEKIVCIQVHISNFEECENVEAKLSQPDIVNICPIPICAKCGQYKEKAKIEIIRTTCWKCGHQMGIAMITSEDEKFISPRDFSELEVELANSIGANIKTNYSKSLGCAYKANTCRRCNAFVGDLYLHEYFYSEPEIESEVIYRCFKCKE